MSPPADSDEAIDAAKIGRFDWRDFPEAQERLASAWRRGGLARAARMTPEQRSAAARKAAQARWAK
jgi:hypothetical protein